MKYIKYVMYPRYIEKFFSQCGPKTLVLTHQHTSLVKRYGINQTFYYVCRYSREGARGIMNYVRGIWGTMRNMIRFGNVGMDRCNCIGPNCKHQFNWDKALYNVCANRNDNNEAMIDYCVMNGASRHGGLGNIYIGGIKTMIYLAHF